jgi:hypothetical protein
MADSCDRSVVFPGYSGFLHLLNWPPRYNWNIVESGVKHHQTNKPWKKLNSNFTYPLQHEPLIWLTSKTMKIYHRRFILREWISQSNITSKFDARCDEKFINDSMITKDLSMWRQWHWYNITLEISDDMFVLSLLLDSIYYRM